MLSQSPSLPFVIRLVYPEKRIPRARTHKKSHTKHHNQPASKFFSPSQKLVLCCNLRGEKPLAQPCAPHCTNARRNRTCVFLQDVVKNRYEIKNIANQNNAAYRRQATRRLIVRKVHHINTYIPTSLHVLCSNPGPGYGDGRQPPGFLSLRSTQRTQILIHMHLWTHVHTYTHMHVWIPILAILANRCW